MNRTALALASLVLTVPLARSTPLAAFDGGLLVNGDFFGSTDSWLHTNSNAGAMSYQGVDATGEPGSGSARITNYAPVNFAGDDAFQCIAGVVPGERYSFGGKIYIVTNDARTGYGSIHVGFHGTSNCSTASLAGDSSPLVSTATMGSFRTVRGPDVVAPPGALAVRVTLHTLKNEADFVLQFHFDDVFLCAASEPCEIFADDFESGGTWDWSSAAL